MKYFLSTVLLAISGTMASAADIPVNNNDFEAQTLADGNFTVSSITGWTLSGTLPAGLFNPTGTAFTGEDGSGSYGNTAFSNGGTLSQVLAATLAPDTTYILSVEVGARKDSTFPGFSVQLVADNIVLAEHVGAANSVATDTFETIQVVFNATGLDPIGSNIEIRMFSAGTQANFDNVSLTADPAGCGAFPATVISQDTTFTIGNGSEDFASIQDAFDCLSSKTISDGARVTLEVSDGVYSGLDTITPEHPNGANIWLVGNPAAPGNVVLQFNATTNGIVMRGHNLGRMDGFTIQGGSNQATGMLFRHSFAEIKNIVVRNFNAGIVVERNSTLIASGLTVTNNNGNGLHILFSASITCDNLTSSNNGIHGIQVQSNSAAFLTNSTTNSNGLDGLSCDSTGFLEVTSHTTQGNGRGGVFATAGAFVWFRSSNSSGNSSFNFLPSPGTSSQNAMIVTL